MYTYFVFLTDSNPFDFLITVEIFKSGIIRLQVQQTFSRTISMIRWRLHCQY